MTDGVRNNSNVDATILLGGTVGHQDLKTTKGVAEKWDIAPKDISKDDQATVGGANLEARVAYNLSESFAIEGFVNGEFTTGGKQSRWVEEPTSYQLDLGNSGAETILHEDGKTKLPELKALLGVRGRFQVGRAEIGVGPHLLFGKFTNNAQVPAAKRDIATGDIISMGDDMSTPGGSVGFGGSLYAQYFVTDKVMLGLNGRVDSTKTTQITNTGLQDGLVGNQKGGIALLAGLQVGYAFGRQAERTPRDKSKDNDLAADIMQTEIDVNNCLKTNPEIAQAYDLSRIHIFFDDYKTDENRGSDGITNAMESNSVSTVFYTIGTFNSDGEDNGDMTMTSEGQGIEFDEYADRVDFFDTYPALKDCDASLLAAPAANTAEATASDDAATTEAEGSETGNNVLNLDEGVAANEASE